MRLSGAVTCRTWSDVDPQTWALDPAALGNHPEIGRVGLVVPVAPFGRSVDRAQWEAFRDTEGVPVVIDGAASFDRLVNDGEAQLGTVPLAISFHATKCFGVGEGGAITSSDTDVVARAAQALNFGFSVMCESRGASINGKMSEYHAAVGHAGNSTAGVASMPPCKGWRSAIAAPSPRTSYPGVLSPRLMSARPTSCSAVPMSVNRSGFAPS